MTLANTRINNIEKKGMSAPKRNPLPHTLYILTEMEEIIILDMFADPVLQSRYAFGCWGGDV